MKLKHLNRSGTWPSGNPRYYFRPKGSKGVPMPDAPITDNTFISAYRAEAEKLETGPRAADVDAMMPLLRERLSKSLTRARSKGMEATLTIGEVLHILHDQGGKCAVSGLPFYIDATDSRRRPYTPSLDRIDPSLGYTKENVRIVCSIVNIAINDFAINEFEMMCRAVASKQ